MTRMSPFWQGWWFGAVLGFLAALAILRALSYHGLLDLGY